MLLAWARAILRRSMARGYSARMGTDCEAGYDHGLEDGMGIALDRGTIHVRPRIAFVRVADDVLHVAVRLAGDVPFHPGGETRAAAAAQPGRLEFRDDILRFHLEQDLLQGEITVPGYVLLDVLRIDDSAVAKNDAELFLVEFDVLYLYAVLLFFLLVEQTLYFAPFYDLFGDDLLRVRRLDFHIEGFGRKDLHDGPFLAETEASGLDDLDVILDTLGFRLGQEILVDLVGLGGFAPGAAADQDKVLVRHVSVLRLTF
jgi:hypothetical protein